MFGACVRKLHLSYLVAFQLHSCNCKHHRRNSNILQCCSLGLYEDAPCSGRHKRTNYLQYRRCVAVGAFSSCLVFSTRFPSICLPSTALFCIGFHPPLLHPPKIKVRGREREISQRKLLSSRTPVDSSGSKTAMIPYDDPAPASSQLSVVLNCQLFTQVITEAVILCKYSR